MKLENFLNSNIISCEKYIANSDCIISKKAFWYDLEEIYSFPEVDELEDICLKAKIPFDIGTKAKIENTYALQEHDSYNYIQFRSGNDIAYYSKYYIDILSNGHYYRDIDFYMTKLGNHTEGFLLKAFLYGKFMGCVMSCKEVPIKLMENGFLEVAND